MIVSFTIAAPYDFDMLRRTIGDRIKRAGYKVNFEDNDPYDQKVKIFAIYDDGFQVQVTNIDAYLIEHPFIPYGQNEQLMCG